MSQSERITHKAWLLSQIQQQRLDLHAANREWLEATGSYDRSWSVLMSLRSYTIIASSIMAVWSVKHPRFLLRWVKRGFGVWNTWRLLRNTFRLVSR